MNGFLSLVGDWHFWALVSAYWFGTAAIGAMPMPDAESSKFYGWLFKTLNTFAGNVSRAFAGKIPGTTDVMPLPGAQEAVQNAAVVAKAVDVVSGK